ncbi:MAG: 2-phosphosulfolactate phosphatase [Pirellulales bacterium]
MSRQLSAHFLPALTSPAQLAGGTVVVIDVLRATTTITQALVSGCREVIPCLEVDEARRRAAELPAGQAVLGGERGGLPIAGFDFGNSPRDYTPANVGGKTVVFTTTNGTKAMQSCLQADKVVLGSFLNFRAVSQSLLASGQVHLLCAGTGGRVTREDVLLAGALAQALSRESHRLELNDEALLARSAWREIAAEKHLADSSAMSAMLAVELRHTQGGRNLTGLGLQHDVDDVAQFDTIGLVGTLDLAAWRITAQL